MDKSVFSKYVARIRKEGIIKSLLYGLINGFAVNFFIMAVFYLIRVFTREANILSIGLWLSIGLGIAVGLITGIILYFTKFKPTTKRVAERLDSLGLEERLITMLEFESDESYIAMKQREDAKTNLGKVDAKAIKFKFARSVIIAAAVLAVIGLSMTTVGALTNFNIIKPINPPVEFVREEYQPVFYDVEGEGGVYGYINGEILPNTESMSYDAQLVLTGQDAETVVAIADEGYAFAFWMYEDGTIDDIVGASPVRTDRNITGPLTIIAVFAEADDTDGDSGPGGEGKPEDKGEEPPKPEKPNPDQETEEGSKSDQEPDPDQESEKGDNENDSGNTDKDNERDPEDNQAGGNDRFAQSNKFKDGETAYQDEFEMWNEQALQELLNSPDLTDEQRAMCEAYLENLAAGVSTSSGSGDSGSNG